MIAIGGHGLRVGLMTGITRLVIAGMTTPRKVQSKESKDSHKSIDIDTWSPHSAVMITHTETRNYRLQTQGIGALLIRLDDGATVFLQGDDASEIVEAVDSIDANNMLSAEDKAATFDWIMSAYNDVME
jgi:hypothetical protein